MIRSTAAKATIRDRALELGFLACRFTEAAPLPGASLLEAWIDQGRHATMDYLARGTEGRLTPTALLENARTLLVVTWPYPPGPPPDPNWKSSLRGRIASYAHGEDYHAHMTRALDGLGAWVRETQGGEFRTHVDAGPLMEKEIAQRAGLGWYGHNTNILSRNGGSYFLIGVLLLEAEFEPDPPMDRAHCGDCRACVPACPTGALDTRPTIDAPKCISYLTIEHRGPIDPVLRPGIGNWVFGCDICQEVCPWNESENGSTDFLTPSLVELLLLSDVEFKARYASTAVARTKRRGLARNAAIALGNSGNVEAVAPLEKALRTDPAALVRAHAAWALGAIGGSRAHSALTAAAVTEEAPPVAAEIVHARAQAS